MLDDSVDYYDVERVHTALGDSPVRLRSGRKGVMRQAQRMRRGATARLRGTAVAAIVLSLSIGTGCERSERAAPTPARPRAEVAQDLSPPPATAPMPAAALDRQAQSRSFLFTNVNVFDGTSDGLAMGQEVRVEGNRIEAVGTNLDTAGATVIDGGGRTLMPGLIEGHGHVMTTENPIKILSTMDAVELGARGLKRANTYLMSGFTTVRDAAGNCFGVKKAVDAGVLPGARIFCPGAGISQTSGHGDFRFPNDGSAYFDGPDLAGVAQRYRMTILADGVPEVQKAVREQLFRGASHIKAMAGGGVTSLVDPLEATQYTLEETKAIVQEAIRYGTYVMAHVHTDEAINMALDAGVMSIEHGALIEEKTVERIAKMGVYFSAQTYIALQDPGGNPALQDPVQIAKLKRTAEGVRDAMRWAKQHEVKVLWGTDIFGPEKFFETFVQEFAYRDEFFTPIEQLQQVTGLNGEVLALSGLKNPYPEGPLGVIKPGAYADILLVDGDPTQDIVLMTKPEENLRIIMKDGVIYKNTLSR